jgi:hypothetical protein
MVPGDSFGQSTDHSARNTTEEELDAIIEPLRDRIAIFKAATQVSWLHLLPAVLKFSVILHVQALGVESVRVLYDNMIQELDASGGIPAAAHLGYSKPPLSKEGFAEIVEMLAEIAHLLAARGHQLERIAQGFAGFAILNAELVTAGDQWLLKSIIAEAARDLEPAPL